MRRYSLSRRALLWSTIGALVGAACLVVFIQRRADARQVEQTHRILQQVCERASAAVTSQIRQLFDAAVIDTLEAIGHPEIKEFDLPRIAWFFRSGTQHHPYVDHFFLWSEHNPPAFRNEVLFFRHSSDGPGTTPHITMPGRQGGLMGEFFAKPEMGQVILRLSLGFLRTRRSFVVIDHEVGGVQYQIVAHILWDDPQRAGFYAVIGYTVNVADVQKRIFARLVRTDLARTLNPDGRFPQLSLTIRDEHNGLVYGNEAAANAPSATSSVDMLFFPGDVLKQWLATRPPERRWQVTVSAQPPAHGLSPGDWAALAVIALIFVALICALTVDWQAVHLSRMQSNFVANVTHDLKTPLSLLLGAADTLGMGRVQSREKVEQYLGIVRTQAARLSRLVDQILCFSRSEGGLQGRPLQSVEVRGLIDDALEALRAAGRNGVTIRAEVETDARLLNADRTGLEQVLLNLLENALNYGNGTNEVMVRAVSDSRRVVIAVRDRGIGIDRADLPHIFDKFYRGRNLSSHARPGFGLGLAIVKSIVTAHGGRIDVESEPGTGSEFTVTLPLNRKPGNHVIPHSDR